MVLGERQPDGATLRQHYENAQRQTGEVPAALSEAPLCPVDFVYLWEYFMRMGMRRTSNGYSLNPISSSELMAWASLNGVQLSSFEVEVLDELEMIFLTHQAEKAAAK